MPLFVKTIRLQKFMGLAKSNMITSTARARIINRNIIAQQEHVRSVLPLHTYHRSLALIVAMMTLDNLRRRASGRVQQDGFLTNFLECVRNVH